LSRLEVNAQVMMLYLKQRKEEVEDSENALRELERLMKNINIMKTEYEQMHKERVRALGWG